MERPFFEPFLGRLTSKLENADIWPALVARSAISHPERSAMIPFPRGVHALFVCSAGINRSPMAAAVFKSKMDAMKFDCKVEYAALHSMFAGMSPAAMWRSVPVARDYEIRAHRSRFLGQDGVYGDATLFFGMDEHVVDGVRGYPRVDAARVHLFNPPNGVFDPQSAQTREAFTACFTQIHTGVDKLIAKLDMQ